MDLLTVMNRRWRHRRSRITRLCLGCTLIALAAGLSNTLTATL
jgi:hypothetical protein